MSQPAPNPVFRSWKQGVGQAPGASEYMLKRHPLCCCWQECPLEPLRWGAPQRPRCSPGARTVSLTGGSVLSPAFGSRVCEDERAPAPSREVCPARAPSGTRWSLGKQLKIKPKPEPRDHERGAQGNWLSTRMDLSRMWALAWGWGWARGHLSCSLLLLSPSTSCLAQVHSISHKAWNSHFSPISFSKCLQRHVINADGDPEITK